MVAAMKKQEVTSKRVAAIAARVLNITDRDMMSVTTVYVYIGTKACGHTVTASVDKPEHREDIAKEIAAWVRDGMTVERVSAEAARSRLHFCDCEKEAKKAKKAKSQQLLPLGGVK